MNRLNQLLLITATCATLVSCGTVATVPAGGEAGAPIASAGKTYSRVVVNDFRSAVSDDDGSTVAAGRKFADIIAVAVRSAKPGATVERNGRADANTLVIGGEITRFVEGNAALRYFVGMGAGSSYFDADVRLSDGGSNRQLTLIRADKNSWGLGGGIAAGQTVEVFMREAAKKVATDAAPLLR
jgi:hypothetical protein